MAEMMLGGIDPENPETIKRFTREVERLAAWNKVEHLGNGVFMIDYSTSGKLADDFAFPVIPRYSLGEPMIHITRWDNGRLRVEAPAFRTDPEMSLSSLIGMGSMAAGFLGKGGSDKMPADPIAIKGTFTLTTDARILANNSEDGPEDANGLADIALGGRPCPLWRADGLAENGRLMGISAQGLKDALDALAQIEPRFADAICGDRLSRSTHSRAGLFHIIADDRRPAGQRGCGGLGVEQAGGVAGRRLRAG